MLAKLDVLSIPSENPIKKSVEVMSRKLDMMDAKLDKFLFLPIPVDYRQAEMKYIPPSDPHKSANTEHQIHQSLHQQQKTRQPQQSQQ